MRIRPFRCSTNDVFNLGEPNHQAGSTSNGAGETTPALNSPPARAGQASLRAQVPARATSEAKPKSKENYFAEWDVWAKEGGPEEQREQAVGKLKEWVNANRPSAALRMHGLKLTSLPENLLEGLPGLRTLVLTNNSLARLPDNLSAPNLKYLDLNFNCLPHLPENLSAPKLETLNVSFNQLTGLPANLLENMPKLKILNLSANLLRHLPAKLLENPPPQLEELYLVNNRLTSVPNNIVSLPAACVVDLQNNPLPDNVRNRIHEAITAADYSGPDRIYFSLTETDDNTHSRPLENAVADWYEEADRAAIKTMWGPLAQEEGNKEGAPAFSKFLDRLRETVNYDAPGFKQSVVEWLSHLPTNPALRAHTFAISSQTLTDCQDRVSFFFNRMKKARINADVQNGIYDDRLEELISLARGMFRLDALEKIAGEKVASLRFVDEIEVYLAYQVKLRETLHLPLDTPDMRFFEYSYVTEEDLAHAEQSVKASEQQEFIPYLSADWEPWQSVLKRLSPSEYAETRAKLIDATMPGAEFEEKVTARLQEIGDGLEDVADARTHEGKVLMAEITREINGQLTRNFLATKDLSHLLGGQEG